MTKKFQHLSLLSLSLFVSTTGDYSKINYSTITKKRPKTQQKTNDKRSTTTQTFNMISKMNTKSALKCSQKYQNAKKITNNFKKYQKISIVRKRIVCFRESIMTKIFKKFDKNSIKIDKKWHQHKPPNIYLCSFIRISVPFNRNDASLSPWTPRVPLPLHTFYFHVCICFNYFVLVLPKPPTMLAYSCYSRVNFNSAHEKKKESSNEFESAKKKLWALK